MLERFEHQFGRVLVERAFCYIVGGNLDNEDNCFFPVAAVST